MKGFTREEDEEEKRRRMYENGDKLKVDLWYRFEYEFLPNFCFICGRLGHLDRECGHNLKKGEEAQFGAWMKAFIPRRSNEVSRALWNEGEAVGVVGAEGAAGVSVEARLEATQVVIVIHGAKVVRY